MEFTYNASALGAGGVIQTGGIITTIPSLASVALAPTGGEGKTIVSSYFSEELSFSHAETRVSGQRTGPNEFTTYTYVYIKDLCVFDRLAIGELRGTVTSIHADRDGDGDDDHDFQLEASYRDVRVAGREVVPSIDLCIGSLKRYNQLGDVLNSATHALPAGVVAPDDIAALAQRFNAKDPAELEKLIGEKRALHGSLVEKVHGDVANRHHKVHVPGLGTVRFGELMLKPGRRRVNLLRIALGANETLEFDEESAPSPDGGSMTIGSVEGNGTPVYP